MDAEVLIGRLQTRGHATLSMRGHSMFPLLPHGSRAVLRPVTQGECLRGAIVAFTTGEKVVVHKVIHTTSALVVTQGIASTRCDAPSPHDAVIGVVCNRRGWPLSELTLKHASSIFMATIRGIRSFKHRLR